MRPALLLLALAGCASPGVLGPVGPPEEELEEAPVDEEDAYLTRARPNGVVGGRAAEELAALVRSALRERGDQAEPDGALAETAGWFLREAAAKRTDASVDPQKVARRYRFAGSLLPVMVGDIKATDRERLRRTLARVPVNVPVTRYGVQVSGNGAAVVFGSVEAALRPIPRRVKPRQSVRLRGEIGKRFRNATAFLTGADGQVQRHALPSRKVDVILRFPVAGVYQAELMGNGAGGPEVLVNVPIYAGVAEPELASGQRPDGRSPPATSPASVAPPPDVAEARMLALLNGVRRRARLSPLIADAELRAVALAHSQDMARGRFVGHVSPVTGTPEDRINRSAAWVTSGGENISLAPTPEAAHEDLMNSPGHRANMIHPRFTHVGIAAVPHDGQLLATLVFGRRPDPTIFRWTAAQAAEGLVARRRARGLPAPQVDPMLAAAAQEGIKVFAQGGPEAAFQVVKDALAREAARRQVRELATCARIFPIIELEELDQEAVLRDPGLRRIGVGVTTRAEGKGTNLVLLVISEGSRCD